MADTSAAVNAASPSGEPDGLPAVATAAPIQPELMGKVKIATLSCLGSAISCASLVASVYLIPFWTDVIGVGPRFMGVVIICGKVAEAVSVVLAGILSDNCTMPLGRRRPFLIACIPAAVFYALLFNPPQACTASSSGATQAWVLSFGLAFFSVWPFLTVCHSSWCAEFCRNYLERNMLYGFRYFWGTIGTMIGAVLPLIISAASGLSDKVQDERTIINNLMGFVVGFIIIVLPLGVFAVLSEKKNENLGSNLWEALVLWIGQVFGAIRHSRTVRVHILISFLYDVALAYAVTFLPYMTLRVHGIQTQFVLGSYIVVSLIFIPFWLKIRQVLRKMSRVLGGVCDSELLFAGIWAGTRMFQLSNYSY